MTKKEWLEVITDRQMMYVKQLANIINENCIKKTINFNSPTGTGKTMMIAMLVNLLADSGFFFLITTLSRGGLDKQVLNSLKKLINNEEYCVYGVSSYTSNTKLQKNEILSLIPSNKKILWIRDEGHIKSNNWMNLLESISYKIINVSATNEQVDIQCNFTDTPLLRTPIQMFGSPRESVERLMEIKKIHSCVPKYNPCLIVRDVNELVTDEFFDLAKEYNLNIVNITDNDINVQELCKNDNDIDIIVNKMKITEGIDIPRGSVFYIGNRPNNDATVIQLIGRVRRNALLWNDDIDIFDTGNSLLLQETTKTYIYYRVDGTNIKTNSDNELSMELSDLISFDDLVPKYVEVKDNCLSNGYKISELSLLNENSYTGKIELSHSGEFVVAENIPLLYQRKQKKINQFGFIYKEIIQDKELVMISFDKTKFFKNGDIGIWKTTTTISDNIKYGKLFKFISKRYASEIANVQIIKQNRDKGFRIQIVESDKKINRCISYLCEFYLKYILFGKEFLIPFVDIARNDLLSINNVDETNVLFYAFGLYYKKQMALFYGELIGRLIPILSIEDILDFPSSLKTQIINMAKEMSDKLKSAFGKYINVGDLRCPHLGNPNILHGTVDLLLEDVLIQFSCKGSYSKEDILKSLGYHYLSTKRYDLSVNRVLIMDFQMKDYIDITIDKENCSKLKFVPSIVTTTSYFNDKIITNFEPNKIKRYCSLYGEEYVLSLLKENYELLNSNKTWDIPNPKNGGKIRIHQKDILKSASLVSNKKINDYLLSVLIPSQETIIFAIKCNNVDYVRENIKKVKITSELLSKAIDSCNLEMVEMAIENCVKLDICHLEKAVLTNDNAIVKVIVDKINITKRIANDVIRTKNVYAIKKMLLKIKPTTYNLIVAIKTNDLTTVELIAANCKSVTNICLDEALKYDNEEVVKFIKGRMEK